MKNNKDKIIQYFYNIQDIQKILYLEQGLSNDNYLISTTSGKEVLRLPKLANVKLFDYSREAHILDLIQDLDLDTPLVYYNANNGIKISKYIENADHFQIKYVQRATILIKRLHSARLVSGHEYNLHKAWESYATIPQPYRLDSKFAMKDFYWVHNFIDESEKILCHNDLVEGNFLFSPNKDYLIDYEYAQDNHPFFDLMSFITENDIQDQNIRKLIYDIYFERPVTQYEQEVLIKFERAHHVLWLQWALFMEYHHQDKIYTEIANLKYQRLIESYE